ncbi:MAG: hypothetical protein JW384_03849 [Nitrosomonadaceae bacterium]|nr:hypothetical protein [Nitrosomonadaceae bacterium]
MDNDIIERLTRLYEVLAHYYTPDEFLHWDSAGRPKKHVYLEWLKMDELIGELEECDVVVRNKGGFTTDI